MSKYGHSFERRAILEWLAEGNTSCPITRKTLKPSMLFPNAALRLRVRSWQRENDLNANIHSCDDNVLREFDPSSYYYSCGNDGEYGGCDSIVAAADRLVLSIAPTKIKSGNRRSGHSGASSSIHPQQQHRYESREQDAGTASRNVGMVGVDHRPPTIARHSNWTRPLFSVRGDGGDRRHSSN